MRYPKEAPLFRNTHDGDKIRSGAIVELIEAHCELWVEGICHPGNPGFVMIRAIDSEDIVADRDYAYACFRKLGYFGCQAKTDDLIPLTPAARAMLAIAKAAGK